MLRAFVALALDELGLDELEAWRAELLPLLPEEAGLTKRHQLHVTIKFLGSVREERAPEIGTAVLAAVESCRAMSSRVTGVVALPSWRHATVLAAALDDAAGALAQLALRCDDALGELGFARETRRFLPHVTLARLRTARRLGRPLQDTAPPKLELSLRELVLYRSPLEPAGSRYEALMRASLAD